MRKLLWIALVALVASSAPIGYVQAEIVVVAKGGDIDQATLKRIYMAVSCETGMCVQEARDAYAEGRMEIEKEPNSYRVTIAEGGGGSILEVIIEDDF